jgi:glutathione synthase/RimK-type ligase-like ATP-grasp enzyme
MPRKTHPAVVSAVERAAAAMGATMAGVDVISPDIRKPEYVVNEVNTTPGLPMHYAAPNHLDPISTSLRQHFDLPAPVHSERERRSG